MIRLLSSEWLRTKRTATRWLTFAAPTVIALCVVGYLALRSDCTQKFAFEGFFTIWSGIIIPVTIGVLAGFIVHVEKTAGNFIGFLGSGISRPKLFLGKFSMLVFCMTICTFVAALVLIMGMNVVCPCGADLKLFLLAALLTSIGTIPLLALHLWVSFAWDMGASIGISFAGLLMAILFGTTSLGTHLWLFVPWTWPVKLGLLPGTSFIIGINDISTADIVANATHTGIVGLMATTAGLCILLSGGMIWFNRWEGFRK